MENEIKASVSAFGAKKLSGCKTGRIILVSTSGLYLQFDQEIFLLCDERWGVLPIGIGVPNYRQAAAKLHPVQGEDVIRSGTCLFFQNGMIRFGVCDPAPEMSKKMVPARELISRAAQELAALEKERGVSLLVRPLILGQPAEEVNMTDEYTVRAYVLLRELMDAFNCNDRGKIGSCVQRLLGLGVGLTPSADDVLMGMAYVFHVFPQCNREMAEEFFFCLEKQCQFLTNRISAAYLKAIIAEGPFERMDSVYRGICGLEPLDIHKLTQIGSSSGSEMLLGMLLALRICGNGLSVKEDFP